MMLQASSNRPIPRQSTQNAALGQVGWLGFTGMIYALDDEPRDFREPGGYSPLYIQIGTWEEIEPGKWSIKD